ncbi:MAG: 1-acyl-sn-glycerol-3-phosphate acyltransferase [Nannocystaceae bacterium]
MLRFLAILILRALRWRIDGALPELDKYVIIGAPHTSNLDGAVFLCGVAILRVRLRFLAKASLLRGPVGALFRHFGAIGVDRSRAHNLTSELAERFRSERHFILALGPDGTRSYRPYWKSGFYHIARAAGVPVLLIGIHGAERRIVLGPTIELSGDVRADMERIRAFYALYGSGVRPEHVGPVRLVEEDEGGLDSEMS